MFINESKIELIELGIYSDNLNGLSPKTRQKLKKEKKMYII